MSREPRGSGASIRSVASRMRSWLLKAIAGSDIRQDIRHLDSELKRLMVAIENYPMHDPSDLTRRTDLLYQGLDRKFEGLFSSLSRQIRSRDSGFSDRQFGLETRSLEADDKRADRLGRYLEVFPEGPVLDIACGRGDFMELLTKGGTKTIGVEPNEAWAKQCQQRGLEVTCQDVFELLQEMEPGSLAGVSSLQVIEHLWPSDVQRLLMAMAAVLRPGGKVLIETPNPVSVLGLMDNWMRDPSHVWAVHPDALRVMVELAGMSVVEIILEPPQGGLIGGPEVADSRVREAILGPENYALVAQKIELEDSLG